MRRIVGGVVLLLLSGGVWAQEEKRPAYPSFDYEVARTHEIKPHRRTIPTEGFYAGSQQLHLKLTVSRTGDILEAEAGGNTAMMKFWPQLQIEVRQWKFTPFEVNGTAITAEVEEYIDIVPPERLPKTHVVAPVVRSDSKVVISLQRTGCYGTCASYTVTVNAEGIVFDGGGFVVASGKHTDRVNVDELRRLAKKFVNADFYSMDDSYRENATDMPAYVVSIQIDGRKKEVEDYGGRSVGMPAVVTDLENEVDAFARTARWIDGDDGLVKALQAERFSFRTFAAQVMLKEAASRGEAQTVREFLEAGVPLKPLPAPKLSADLPIPPRSAEAKASLLPTAIPLCLLSSPLSMLQAN